MTKEELQEKTNLLLGKTMARGFDGQCYVEWAISLMKDGYEFQELDILASIDVIESREIEKYFKQVCEKLELELLPEKQDCLKIYLVNLAQRVVDGIVDINKAQELIESIWQVYDEDFGGIDGIAYAPDYWFMMELPNGAEEDGYENYLMNEFMIYLANNTKL